LNTFKAFFPSVAVETLYPSNSRFSLMASNRCSSSSTNRIRCLVCCIMVVKYDFKNTPRRGVVFHFYLCPVFFQYRFYDIKPQSCPLCLPCIFVTDAIEFIKDTFFFLVLYPDPVIGHRKQDISLILA